MKLQAKVWKDIGVIVLFVTLVIWVLRANAADELQLSRIVRLDDAFMWSPLTIALCFSGWVISLISDWGVKWNLMRLGFHQFVLDNLPRIIIGAISVGVCYVLIPELITSLDLKMKMTNLGAFAVGLSADVIVHRIRGLVPQPPEVRENERAKVRARLDDGDEKTRP